jgi:hypothetical protein
MTKRTRGLSSLAGGALLFASLAAGAAEDITAYVVEIDSKAKCLELDWNNDTRKRVCWSAETKFSLLETGKAANATAVRVGSYLRIVGDEQDGTLRAKEIEIWESAAKPESKP